MKKGIKLLDQIIEKAMLDDEEYKKQMISQHKASKTVGKSWMVFHLKELRKLMLKESNGKS